MATKEKVGKHGSFDPEVSTRCSILYIQDNY